MHELSIARSIVATATEGLNSRTGTIREIGLRIGALAGVFTDSLEFCFEAITKDTALDGCTLAIERLPVIATCSRCNRSFQVAGCYFACPSCGSGSVTVTQGYELEIFYLEVDDSTPAPGVSINGIPHVDKNSA